MPLSLSDCNDERCWAATAAALTLPSAGGIFFMTLWLNAFAFPL
jgi:hypothetical protein